MYQGIAMVNPGSRSLCMLVFVLIIAFALLWQLATCSVPLELLMLDQVKDVTGPEIHIISPVDESFYASTVVVSGRVTDRIAGGASVGKVEQLTYDIIPATISSGTIDFNEEGYFSFQFPTGAFTGPMVVVITAIDWNGNNTVSSINLNPGESDIPSFSVFPGNQTVYLQWDDVPLAARYDLFYTTNGAIPSESYGHSVTDVSSPFLLSDLENGGLHRFLLISRSTEGEDNLSSVMDVIPLSPLTLAPSIDRRYGSISVRWDSPVAALYKELRYDVLRSMGFGGEFVIRGTSLTNSFVDTDIHSDAFYYYKIRLNSSPEIISLKNYGMTSIFPPGKTKALGECDTDFAYGIDIYGNYAYVGDLTGGFRVIGIGDRENIVQTGQYPLNTARGVAVDFPYAYVADGPEGLKILNISNPNDPVLVGSCDTIEAMDVVLQGDLIFMADWNAGLVVIDVSDKEHPYIRDYISTSTAKSIAVGGNYAYIGDDFGGLKIFNVSDPDNLLLEGSCHTNKSGTTSTAWGVDVRGDYAYVCDWYEGLKVIDVSDKMNPAVVADCDTSYAREVSLSGDFAYVADAWGGLKIINISNPLNPVHWASFPSYNACTVVADQQHVYIADAGEGVIAVAFQSPASPSIVSTSVSTDSRSVIVNEQYAFVADYSEGFKIYDISNPSSPVQIAIYETYQAQGVCSLGNLIFVSDSNEGLKVFDVSNVHIPEIVGSIDTVFAIETVIYGNYAYVADYVSGIKVIDISNPEKLRIAGECFTYQARSLVVDDNFLYVADYLEGLKIIDLTSPENPYEVSRLMTGMTGTYGIAKSGDYLFLADVEGLIVVNVRVPYSPLLVSADSYAGPLYSLHLDGSYIYAVGNEEAPHGNKGVYIYDISDPANPFLTGTWDADAVYTRDIFVSSRYAYLADGTGGLKILDLVND